MLNRKTVPGSSMVAASELLPTVSATSSKRSVLSTAATLQDESKYRKRRRQKRLHQERLKQGLMALAVAFGLLVFTMWNLWETELVEGQQWLTTTKTTTTSLGSMPLQSPQHKEKSEKARERLLFHRSEGREDESETENDDESDDDSIQRMQAHMQLQRRKGGPRTRAGVDNHMHYRLHGNHGQRRRPSGPQSPEGEGYYSGDRGSPRRMATHNEDAEEEQESKSVDAAPEGDASEQPSLVEAEEVYNDDEPGEDIDTT